MKRSEMIKKIASVLNNLSKVEMSNLLRAEIVLDEVERQGMLPNTIIFLATGEYNESGPVVREALGESYDAKVEWEQE